MFVLALCAAACTGEGSPDPTQGTSTGDAEWTLLFNGRDLTGWTPKIRGHPAGEDPQGTFRVENGVLSVGYDAYDGPFDDRFGHLFHQTPRSDYRLRVEYRFVGEQMTGGPGWALRNSGVMFHSQSPQSMGDSQDFPISLEAQFLGGTGEGRRPTANLCTPGTHVTIQGTLETRHCIEADGPTIHGDAWVVVELEVLSDSIIRHYVDGELVLEYTNPVVGGGEVHGFDPAAKTDGAPLRSGYIAIQSESHPIEFRRIELLPLGDTS
ncbi:MAG: DUF1080 domain-containing protein [Gemmatimonadetes bacterium]|nr:DUF1080 domain-containing protein [Gemmatimonadota bacterium]